MFISVGLICVVGDWFFNFFFICCLFPYMEVMGSLILLSGYCRGFILNWEKCLFFTGKWSCLGEF